MLSKKHLLFTLVILLIGSMSIFAQDEDGGGDDGSATDTEATSSGDGDDASADGDDYPYPSVTSEEYKDFVPKRRQDQQDKFLDRKYNFPAKPRDKWEVGLAVGPLLVSGDIKTGLGRWSHAGEFNWKAGIGLHVRKSFGYLFSVRLSGMMGTTWGQNWQSTNGWSVSSVNNSSHKPNQSLTGNAYYDQFNDGDGSTPNYVSPDSGNGYYIYYNYKTKIRELCLSGIVNLHNIRFHKRETGLNLYGIFGIGGFAYRTWQDQLDADGNEYDYAPAMAVTNGLIENRNDLIDILYNDIYDGTFESQAERHFDDYTPFGNFSFKPTAHLGVGTAIKITRLINISLESKVTYTNDDLLDGQRWQEWGALTRDYDTYVWTGVGVNVNLGAKNSVEPLWWMNPLDYSYEELNEAPCCDTLDIPDFEDDDNDGVPNAWDEEPDSREGCPVDTKGRMLDSDRDGVLDCDDKCPHSRAVTLFGTGGQYKEIDLPNAVDEFGCLPALGCKDIPDLCDCVKACVPPPRPPIGNPGPPPSCMDNSPLPSILFDLNRYGVRPEFEGQLASVADWLRRNPTDNICVIGHTDARSGSAYNDVLSYKRANEVINQLVAKYGIDRSRLILQYRGESSPDIGGLADSPMQKGVDADHALNRRVEFRCCTGQYNMSMPAGPSNAGRKSPKPRP